MGRLISCYRKTQRFSDMSDRYMSTSFSEHFAASIFRKEDIYCRFLRNVRAVYQKHDFTSQETHRRKHAKCHNFFQKFSFDLIHLYS